MIDPIAGAHRLDDRWARDASESASGEAVVPGGPAGADTGRRLPRRPVVTPDGEVVNPWSHLSARELAGASYALHTIRRARVFEPAAIVVLEEILADVIDEAIYRLSVTLPEHDAGVLSFDEAKRRIARQAGAVS